MKHHESYIAGIKFRKGARECLDSLPIGNELDLRPEPDNPHDPNAVAVYSGDQQVGYVPAMFAEDTGRLIEQGRLRQVTFEGGTRMHIHYEEQEDDRTDGEDQD